MKLEQGQAAPDFKLLDQDGNWHKLSDYLGDYVFIYFYPKDDTPGCTKEACAIRDNLPSFEDLRLKVVGVSVDSVSSHKKFVDKYKLSFTLLADEDKEVVRAYGVWAKKRFMGREYFGTLRTSFLIDPSGKIVKIYENVKSDIHAGEVLRDIKEVLA